MDFFSHALLPYLLGTSSRLKKEDVTAFVLGGIAPDIDVFIMWINVVYPTFFLITHRGITHSLFFGFFTGFAVLYLATRARTKSIVRRFVKYDPVISRRTVLFAYAGVLLHLFMDYTTTHGVPLFFPFDPARYSAEVFFYTDQYLTILSLIIIIYLYKKPFHTGTTAEFLIVFLLVFAGLGGLRIAEKNSAEGFFRDTKVYPTADIFDWYALGEDASNIRIYEYNTLNRTSVYNQTDLKMNIVSQGEGLDSALDTAGELPQVKMFKWNAYSVAMNVSSSNGAWHLEYYDPLQKAMMRDISPWFRSLAKRFGTLNVTVEGGKAFVTQNQLS